MRFTVLGGGGFIGGALVRELTARHMEVFAPDRAQLQEGFKRFKSLPLGNVVYCIGLTADFRERRQETIDAHVTLLSDVIRHWEFQSITYLSSTRVYSGNASTAEDAPILCPTPADPDSIYNISKLMGESICLQCSKRGRVVRIANVYGEEDRNSGNFLTSVLREAVAFGHVKFRSSAESAKDYVSIADVTSWLIDISSSGKFGIYNIASGRSTSNLQISNDLEKLGITTEFAENAPTTTFPEVSIEKVSREFGGPRRNLLSDMPGLIDSMRTMPGQP